MAKYGMVIDCTKCTGCYNCFLACRDEFAGNEYPGYTAAQPMAGQNWIHVMEKERGKYPKVKVAYTPIICMHCEDATCIKAARNNAVYRRPDGIVIIDPEKAKGQKQIIEGCPYRVIEWNEEKQLPQKCIFCAHMLDKGEKEPRCVESCPTGALIFGDLSDPNSDVSRLLAAGNTEIMHPEYNLKEKVSYIGLPKKFVAGTVIYKDKDECAGGVEVTLSQKGKVQKTRTNGFGDFEFEFLPPDTEYTVNIEAKGYKPRKLKALTRVDVYLGEIALSRS
jgi:Fe-S-cluster-containing dehydrogenase component